MARWLALARFLLAVALLSGCATRDAVRDRGMVPTGTTLEALEQALEPRRIVLVIGVDEYRDPGVPDLRLAVADADAIADRLSAKGRFDEVIRLTQPERTERDRVFQQLRELSLRLRREDTLVVYFSGHGTRVPDEDRWRRFLMTTDTDAGDLEGTAIDLAGLQAWFSRLAPERKALIVDACFNGDGRSVVRPTGSPPTVSHDGSLIPSAIGLATGEAHLMATSAGRPAREADSLGHGVYTFHLLDALSWGFEDADKDDDGVVTAFEAHDHARGAVIAYTEGAQVPEAVFRVLGTADIVLGGDPEKRRARKDALIYLYSGSDTVPRESRVIVDGRDRGALPGSVTVPSGKQAVELVSGDGAKVSTGQIRLRPGKTYRADHLARILGGPSRMFDVRGATTALPLLDGLLSPAATGVELGLRFRLSQRAPRGLYLDTRIATGLASPLQTERSSTTWTGVGVGWQRDLGRIRLGLGVQGSLAVIPPVAQGPEVLQGGWWFWGMGPQADLGLALGEEWALVGGLRLSLGALDPERDGTLFATAHPMASVGTMVAF